MAFKITLATLATLSTLSHPSECQLVPDPSVRQVIVCASFDKDRPHPDLDSMLVRSMERAALRNSGCALVSPLVIEAKERELAASESNSRTLAFRLAEALKVDWFLSPKLHIEKTGKRETLFVEVDLALSYFGGTVSNGFGKFKGAKDVGQVASKLSHHELDSAMTLALQDALKHAIPMATVMTTYEAEAKLTPIHHPELIPGLPAVSLRGRNAWSLFYVKETRHENPIASLIRMHGAMPGDRMQILNVREGPGRPPNLSEYYRPPRAVSLNRE